MLMDRVLVTRCLSIYDEHYVYVEDSDVCDYCFYYRRASMGGEGRCWVVCESESVCIYISTNLSLV